MMNKDFKLWLEFEAWESSPEDDSYNDFFNMKITLSDSSSYSLNVWTYGFLNRAVEESKINGENLSGKYEVPPDLFVEKLDRGLIEEVVTDLIGNNLMKPEWKDIET